MDNNHLNSAWEQNLAWVVIGMSVLVLVSLLGTAVALIIMLDRSAAHYPGATMISGRHSLQAAPSILRVRRIASFSSTDDLPEILQWYSNRFELHYEMKAQSGCVHLLGRSDRYVISSQISVTICDTPKDRLIFFQRSNSLSP